MILDNPVILYNNTSMEMIAFGTFIFHCVVCVANLKVSQVSVIQDISRYVQTVITVKMGTIMMGILHFISHVNTV
jgi:hypothetical protein